MKLLAGIATYYTAKDAPSRGHDLKLTVRHDVRIPLAMPPHGGMT